MEPLAPPRTPRLAERGIALVFGPEERALRPLFLVRFVGTLAFSGFWVYVGIWAQRRLGASTADVGTLFLANAIVFALAAWLGGNLSDRVGRRTVIVPAIVLQATCFLSLAFVHGRLLLGAALVMLSSLGAAPFTAAIDALVADVVPTDRQEEAYAGSRVAANSGAALGPALAALTLALGGWTALIVLVGCLGFAAALAATRLPAVAPSHHGETQRAVIAQVLRDRPFLLLLASVFLGFVVYVSYEAVLPVIATDSYGLKLPLWGVLVVVNPVLVAALQLRLTRAAEPLGAVTRLVLAMLLMGFSFLLLLATSTFAALLVVVIVFVFGEMLWIPTSQAIAGRLAPDDRRGAYMGLMATASSVSWMLGPFLLFRLREATTSGAVWIAVAVIAVVGAVAGAVAARAGN
jgi:MFS family permease